MPQESTDARCDSSKALYGQIKMKQTIIKIMDFCKPVYTSVVPNNDLVDVLLVLTLALSF